MGWLRGNHDHRPREVTGRTVLICLLAFFGIVGAVNAALVRAATSTFGGVETKSSYQAGKEFGHEIAAAHAQDARHWRVDAALRPVPPDRSQLSITVRGRDGTPPSAITVLARLAHPVDERRDHQLVLRQIGPGVFSGTTRTDPGQWDLEIDVVRNGERLFRSKSRVTLR